MSALSSSDAESCRSAVGPEAAD